MLFHVNGPRPRKRRGHSLVRIIGEGVAHEGDIRDPLWKPVVPQKRLKEGQVAMRHIRHRIQFGRVILRLSLEREHNPSETT